MQKSAYWEPKNISSVIKKFCLLQRIEQFKLLFTKVHHFYGFQPDKSVHKIHFSVFLPTAIVSSNLSSFPLNLAISIP